jgi:hypothetical protein
MVLSHKLITNHYNYVIEDRNIILLIIIHLHINKKINDVKLKASFKNYRNRTLNRLVNTYHCRINNKWYNDEQMKTIYLDIYEDIEKKDLTIEQVLPYINLLLNKNKNYCIDFIYKQYVEPISSLTYYSYGEVLEIFDSFKIKGIELISFEDAIGLGDGYCCEDCSGDYEQYKYSNYEDLMSNDFKKKFLSKSKEFLRNKKTASSYKNPNNILY